MKKSKFTEQQIAFALRQVTCLLSSDQRFLEHVWLRVPC